MPNELEQIQALARIPAGDDGWPDWKQASEDDAKLAITLVQRDLPFCESVIRKTSRASGLQDVDDPCSEAVRVIYRAAQRYDQSSGFWRPFLGKCMRNKVRDHARQARRNMAGGTNHREEVPDHDDTWEIVHEIINELGLDDNLIDKADREIKQQLDRLHLRKQDAAAETLQAYWFQNHGVNRIARDRDVSPATISGILSNQRTTLNNFAVVDRFRKIAKKVSRLRQLSPSDLTFLEAKRIVGGRTKQTDVSSRQGNDWPIYAQQWRLVKGTPEKICGSIGPIVESLPTICTLEPGHAGACTFTVDRPPTLFSASVREDDPPHEQRVLPINLSAAEEALVDAAIAAIFREAAECPMPPKSSSAPDEDDDPWEQTFDDDHRPLGSGRKSGKRWAKDNLQTDRDDLRFRVERGYSAASIAKCLDLAPIPVPKKVRSQINEKYPKVEIPQKRSLATVPTQDAASDCYAMVEVAPNWTVNQAAFASLRKPHQPVKIAYTWPSSGTQPAPPLQPFNEFADEALRFGWDETIDAKSEV